MIGKVLRGQRPAGLIRYLYGPGRREEHRDPHIVAGWRDPAELEPSVRPDGRRDFRRITGLLTQPHAALGPRGLDRPVWHCVVRAAPGTGCCQTPNGDTWPGTSWTAPASRRTAKTTKRSAGSRSATPTTTSTSSEHWPARTEHGPSSGTTTSASGRPARPPRNGTDCGAPRRATARQDAARPGGAREGPPPGTARSAPDHAPADGQHRGGRGRQRGRILRLPPRGRRAGPRPVQHPQPGPGHRLRRRARR